MEVPYLKNYYEFIIEFGVTKLNSTVPHPILSSLIFFSNPAWTSDRNCAIEFFRTRYKTNTDKKKYSNRFHKKMSYFDTLFSIHILHEFDPLLVLIVLKLYTVWSKRLETYASKT